jgi:hypothetical protein
MFTHPPKKKFIMKTLYTIIASLLVTSATYASFEIDFLVDSASSGASRLNYGNSITWDFSIDGSGNVSLDTTASSGGTTPNAGTGAVGTVADLSLAGTTFTLTTTTTRQANGSTTISTGSPINGEGAQLGTTNGMLGLGGGNSSQIDGRNGGGNPLAQESMIFTLSTTNQDLVLNLNGFSVGAESNSETNYSSDGGSTYTLETNSSGQNSYTNIVNSSIANGGAFSWTNALVLEGSTKNSGYGLDSITLTATAIPETSFYGLLAGLSAFSCILLRQRRS